MIQNGKGHIKCPITKIAKMEIKGNKRSKLEPLHSWFLSNPFHLTEGLPFYPGKESENIR